MFNIFMCANFEASQLSPSLVIIHHKWPNKKAQSVCIIGLYYLTLNAQIMIDRRLMRIPHTLLCNSFMTYSTSSFEIHFKVGTEKPILCKYSQLLQIVWFFGLLSKKDHGLHLAISLGFLFPRSSQFLQSTWRSWA